MANDFLSLDGLYGDEDPTTTATPQPKATPPAQPQEDFLSLEGLYGEEEPERVDTQPITAPQVGATAFAVDEGYFLESLNNVDIPDKTEAAKQLYLADKKRQEQLTLLHSIEAMEKQLKEQFMANGWSEKEAEEKTKEKVNEIARQQYGGSSFDEILERLWSDKMETTSPREEMAALRGEKSYFSPLKLLGTVLGDMASPSKWSGVERDPRQKVKARLSRPLISRGGYIDTEALAYSDMPREWQNQFMAAKAAQESGIPTAIWNDIIQARLGSLPGSSGWASALKRTGQIADSIAFNVGTKIGTRSKIEAIKKMEPPMRIDVVKRDGKWVFDMPGTSVDGMEVEDFSGDPTTETGQRELWRDFIANISSNVSDQSLSNLADVAGMGVELVGGGLLAATGVGAPVGGAMIANRAAKLGKVGNRAKSILRTTYKGLQGDIPLVSQLSKLTPGGRQAAYKLLRDSPRMAGALQTADRLATVAATHTVMTWAGSGEKSGWDHAIAAGAMSVPLNLAPAVREGFTTAALSKYPKAYKEISRAKGPEDLSKFSRQLIAQSGMTFDEVKANFDSFRENSEMMLDAAAKIESGQIPEKFIPEVVSNVANSPIFRDQMNRLSRETKGLGVEGRWNQETVKSVLQDLQAANRELLSMPTSRANDGTATTDVAKVRQSSLNRARKELKEAPLEIWEDTNKLMSFIRDNKNTKGFSDEIINALENRGGLDVAYNRFAGQMLQAALISKGMGPNVTPATVMRVFTNMLAEPGDDLLKWKVLKERGDEVRAFRDVTGDTREVSRISPKKTVEGMLEYGADTIRSVLKATKDIIDEYTGLGDVSRGSGVPGMRRGLQKRQAMLRAEDAKFNRETSMKLSDLSAMRRSEAKASKKAAERVAIATQELKNVDQKTIRVIRDALANKDRKVLAEQDKGVVNSVRRLVKAENSRTQHQARLAEIADRRQELLNYKETGEIEALNRAYRFADTETDAGMALRESIGLKELDQRSDFWRRLTEKIAYEQLTSIEQTGIPIVSRESLQAMRMLENDRFLREVAPGLDEGQRAKIRNSIGKFARAINRHTGFAKVLRDKMKLVREAIENAGDSQQKRAAALAQMRLIRNAYGGYQGIKKQYRELDAELQKVCVKMDAGEVLTEADKLALYKLSKSNIMAMYRIEYNPKWAVSMAEEAQSVFRAIDNTSGKTLDLFTRELQRYMPEAGDVDVAIAIGRLLNVGNHFDSSGWLGVAMMAARHFREGQADVPIIDLIGTRMMVYSQDNFNAYLSRETGIAVDTAMAKYNASLARAKQDAYRINEEFFKGLDKIPGYKALSGDRRLIGIMKRFSGYQGFDIWPMLNGQKTEFGKILFDAKVNGKNPMKLLEPLYKDAEKLSREALTGTGIYRKKVSEYSQRIDELNKMRDAFEGYWNVEADSPDMWRLAFEVQEHIQTYDRLRLDAVNSTIRELNKLWGTKYAEFRYDPWRLDSYTRRDINRLQNYGHMGVDSFFQGATGDALSKLVGGEGLQGRTLATGEAGQIRKVSTLREADIDDPRESFCYSTEMLFREIHSRDAMTDLRNAGLQMRDSGYDRFADAFAMMVTRQFADIARISHTRRIIQWAANKFSPVRVISSYFNPFTSLATLYKTGIENPLQTFIMAAGSSVRDIPTLPKDSVTFMRKWVPRILKPDQTAEGFLKEIQEFAQHIPPEAQRAMRQHIASARKLETDEFRRQRTVINWDASETMKKAYRAGKYVDWLNEGLFGRFKDNSETAVKEIYAKYAVMSYVKAIEAINKAPDQPAKIAAARDALSSRLSGTAVAVDVTQLALNLVRDVERKTPYRGLSGYLFQIDSAMIGRFDTNNVPPLLVAIDRFVPGVASFANPIYNTTFRMIKFLTHSLTTRGAISAEAALGGAFVGALAFVGLSVMLRQMQSTDDDFGLGESSYLQRLDPLIQITDTLGGLKGAWKSPAVRVGSMGERAFLRTVSALLGVVGAIPDAALDRSADKSAQIDLELEKALFGLAEEIEAITPAVFLRDILGSPVGWGLSYLAYDDSYLQHRLEKELENDPLISSDFEREELRKRMTPAQDFILSLSALLTPENDLIDLERFDGHEQKVKLALGKMGIGVEATLLYNILNEKRREKEAVKKRLSEMQSRGALVYPGELAKPQK